MLYPINMPVRTVGAAPTTQDVMSWAIPVGLGVLGLFIVITVYVKFIDPLRHRERLMKQREALIKLAYHDVIAGDKSGEEARDWLLKQFASASSMYEDPLYDVEGIRAGEEVLYNE